MCPVYVCARKPSVTYVLKILSLHKMHNWHVGCHRCTLGRSVGSVGRVHTLSFTDMYHRLEHHVLKRPSVSAAESNCSPWMVPLSMV